MKKRIFSLMFAACAVWSLQVQAQVRESFKWDFEKVVPVEGVNFQASYDSPAVSWNVTDNPVAEDGWDGADAEKDPINSSPMCLEITRVGTNDWEGPSFKLNGDKGVKIDPLNDATWFLHVQFLLPEGIVPGKGRAGFNCFGSLDGWKESSTAAVGDWFIKDYDEAGTKTYPADYESMAWIEFDIDLRPWMGKTFHWIQMSAEFGGTLNYFIDNICIDNRAKSFPAYDFGTHVPIIEEGTERMFIFYPGTKQCITAQDQPANGYAAVQFCEFQADNQYQVWNVSKDEEMTFNGEPLYTIEYDYSFLYSDGTLRAATDEASMRWFQTKYKNKPKYPNTMLVNAGAFKYLKPNFLLDGVEIKASSDTIQWIFVKESEIDNYLTSTNIEIEKQVPNGDYYIFYAGTNYCMTDRRLMGWEIGADGTDSIYYPIGQTRALGNGSAIWSITLEEFDPTNDGQQWTLRNYSEDVDNDYERTYWKRNGGTRINGHPQLVSEHWHWVINSDSITRAVGARQITGKPYDLEWIDVDGQTKVVKDYCSIFGDNATIINDDNNQAWFVKQIPMNKDGIAAIYRPNNGYQGTALKNKYAGGSLYATPNGSTGKLSETQIYCWKFVELHDAKVQSLEASKALIQKDTVFGYPTTIEPGRYRIVYRGTNQALALDTARLSNGLLKNAVKITDFDKTKEDQIWEIEKVSAPVTGYDKISDQYIVKNVTKGGQIIYPKSGTGDWVWTYTKEDAIKYEQKEYESYMRFLGTTSSKYGADKAFIMVANNKNRKFLRTYVNISNTGIGGYGDTGLITDETGQQIPEFPFVLIPENADLPTITRSFGKEVRITPGWYYVQYAYANDSTDKTKPYVMAAPKELVYDALNRNIAYSPEDQSQRWYITYTDTAAVRKGTTPDTRYFLFAGQSVADTLSKGASDLDLITMGGSFVWNDWSKVQDGKNYSWFTYRFYEKDGKISIKESEHNQWMADKVALGTGIYALKGDPARSGNGSTNEGWGSTRIYTFHLIPEGEAFVPVSDYAPWHPLANVLEYTLGDVNNDGKINVSDVVATVNSIIGNPVGTYSAKAADMNSDGKVNVSDVVAIVNVILNPEATTSAATLATGEGSLAIEGNKLILTSNTNIGGFDFAYEGELVATEALKDFIVIPYVKEGQKRIIAYTMERGVLTAGTTALFASSKDLTISDPIFVAENATELVMENNVVTSNDITTIGCTVTVNDKTITATTANTIEIYNTAGVMVASGKGASIAVPTLTPDSYVVKAYSESGVTVEKVIIK